MNIAEIVGAGVASLALAGGGISVYSSSVGKDSLTQEHVATLLESSKNVSEGLNDLSTKVSTLEVKQIHTEGTQEQFLYSIRDLTKEIRGVNKHLLILRGEGA